MNTEFQLKELIVRYKGMLEDLANRKGAFAKLSQGKDPSCSENQLMETFIDVSENILKRVVGDLEAIAPPPIDNLSMN